MLRALSLCTCCRQYPGTATDGTSLLIHSVVSAFPRRAAGSACALSVSRFARRSLALRPAHSRCHRILWPAIRRLQPFRYLHSCSGCFRLEHFAGWGFHPLELSRLPDYADENCGIPPTSQLRGGPVEVHRQVNRHSLLRFELQILQEVEQLIIGTIPARFALVRRGLA